MKKIWETQALRINALSLRERVIMFASVSVVLVALVDSLVFSPSMAELRKLSAQLREQTQQLDTLRRDTAIVVAQPAQQIQKLFEIVSNVDGIFIGMAVVVLISSSLSTMLALYNSMAARTRQIAVLRVLGASQGRVFGLVLTESLVITMAGALSGIVLALLGGIAASAWLKASIGLVIDPTLDPRSTVIVLGGAVALGGIAGILPAWRAYQVPVADNLRPAA